MALRQFGGGYAGGQGLQNCSLLVRPQASPSGSGVDLSARHGEHPRPDRDGIEPEVFTALFQRDGGGRIAQQPNERIAKDRVAFVGGTLATITPPLERMPVPDAMGVIDSLAQHCGHQVLASFDLESAIERLWITLLFH